MQDERLMFSIEAEHGVLGALMQKADLAEKVGSVLLPEHFYHEDNAMLYAMILAERSKGNTPDPITLSEYRSELPSGTMTIVHACELQMKVPGYSNVMRYAQTVKERHQARKLQSAAWEIGEMASMTGSIAEQVARAQAILMALEAPDERPDVITMSDALPTVIDQLDEANARDPAAPEVVKGVQFNLKPLDKIIKSIRPGNFAVIAGRPGTGKTVLGLGLADEVAIAKGGAVLVFTLEMEASELARRSLSANSGVIQDVLDGTVRAEDGHWPSITAGVNKLVSADYRLCEKPGLPFSRIASIARYQHRVKPLDLIVIDYIGLISPEPGSRLFNRTAELGVVSRGIKALAKELKVPVVALAQLNRGIEGRAIKRPQMSDLRDCGDIEQDADIIIIAHRDESTNEGADGITEIYVEKCRHAKVGHCQLQFRGEIAKFVPAAMKRYGDTEARPDRRPSTKSFF